MSETATTQHLETVTTPQLNAPVQLPPERHAKSSKEAQKKKTPEEVAKEREEFLAKKKERLDRKIAKASRPDTVVISRTTIDTNEMADLLGANDRLMSQLRRKLGYVKALTPDKFHELFERSQEIKKNLHEFNMEIAHLIGEKYVAPRGYLGGRQD